MSFRNGNKSKFMMSITPFDHLDIGPVFIGTFVKQNNVLWNNYGGYLLQNFYSAISIDFMLSDNQDI
jgi:hypothetical protein